MKSHHDAMRDAERAYFSQLLAECGGCIAQVARVAEINRTHVYQKLIELGMRQPSLGNRGNKGNDAWQALGR